MTSKKNISIPASKLTDATATQVSTTPKNDKTMISDNSNNSTLAVNNDNADNNTTATTLFAEESASTVQPKQQRKSDYAEFKAAYLAPSKLEKRHPVNIEDNVWAKLERIARILGDRDTTVGSYINAILSELLDLYADDIEVWRKL